MTIHLIGLIQRDERIAFYRWVQDREHALEVH
jgi:hypothetical protein